MRIYYFYLILLLLMFTLIYYGISYSLKFAPLKIRALSISGLAAISIRCAALIIFLLAKNIKNLYLLKPFMFLNLICIPVLAMTAVYILSRNDKIKFNYCLILSLVLIPFYIFILVKFQVSIENFRNIGYIMNFSNKNIQYAAYVIINTLFLFQAFIFLGNKNSNKLGMWLILVSSFIAIAEVILRDCGLIILPAVLLGDVLWTITLDYAISKLRK